LGDGLLAQQQDGNGSQRQNHNGNLPAQPSQHGSITFVNTLRIKRKSPLQQNATGRALEEIY
jgi:hypothetical protein